ncbi:MAG: FAD-dependent oxidoreductase [Lentisphaerae bacterium]|nr:FAD-dependent oxidoreductase [Lentisphaerota bacterium]
MKIVIIGGVAAGMSTAARLRRLDEQAQIVVLERGEHVSFANCGLPYHIGGQIKGRESLLLHTPASLKSLLNLDVRTGHEVTGIDRAGKVVQVRAAPDGRTYAEPYDKLVLCPGAQPLRPPLLGIEHAAVLTLRNVADMDAIKARVDGGAKRAVVIGAGFIGLEMVESLHARGLAVEVVELQSQVLPPLDHEMARFVEDHLRQKGVTAHLGTSVTGFRDAQGAVMVDLQNGTVLTADLAILAVGVKPDTALAKVAGLAVGPQGGIHVDACLCTSDPDIYAAGDAIEGPSRVRAGDWCTPLAGPANRQGRTVADNLAGRRTPWGGTLGTAIVKAFNICAASTGMNEKSLQRDGVAYRKVYVHAGHHAGYYPGAELLHLKVLFAPDTGRLLGAQAVGGAGVDKRIDVLATALTAGMSVFDLQHLELAYAPQFGSAKDPVNMAGFIGANLLNGDLEPWYAEDYPAAREDGIIVDVRPKADYEAAHVPGARHVPLPELRARLGELPADKTIYLYCKIGFRSYLAMRILTQRGFKVRSLAGGFDTFRAWHGGATA